MFCLITWWCTVAGLIRIWKICIFWIIIMIPNSFAVCVFKETLCYVENNIKYMLNNMVKISKFVILFWIFGGISHCLAIIVYWFISSPDLSHIYLLQTNIFVYIVSCYTFYKQMTKSSTQMLKCIRIVKCPVKSHLLSWCFGIEVL